VAIPKRTSQIVRAEKAHAIAVISHGQFPVASRLFRAAASRYVLSFVTRATFRLAPGISPLASVQLPPNVEDVPHPDARSIRTPSDLAPYKASADVVLVGHAHSPGQRPVSALVARLAIGPIEKIVEVVSNRTIDPQGRMLKGPPFTKMPLRWERSAEGPHNPVGVTMTPDQAGNTRLPNLQPRRAIYESIPTTGFGPIPFTWRVDLADPTPSLEDHNVAPADQRMPYLTGDETLSLDNLLAEYPRLVTKLAPLTLTAQFEADDGTVRDVPLVRDTLWIDTDTAVATVTFRGRVEIANPSEEGRVLLSAAGAALEAPIGVDEDEDQEKELSDEVSGPTSRDDVRASVTEIITGALPTAAATPFVPAPIWDDEDSGTELTGQRVPTTEELEIIAAAAEQEPVWTRTTTTVLENTKLPSTPPPAEDDWAPVSPQRTPSSPPIATVASTPIVPISVALPLLGDRPDSALSASNAAAALGQTSSAYSEADTSPRIAPGPVELLELLAFDPSALPALRRRFQEELSAPRTAADPSLSPAEVRSSAERQDLYRLLESVKPTRLLALESTVGVAASLEKRFVAPVVLLEGDLEVSFDDAEVLGRMIEILTPLEARDAKIKALLEDARGAHALSALRSPATAANELLLKLTRERCVVSGPELEQAAYRSLLDEGKLLRRTVFGAQHLRAALGEADTSFTIPTYLAPALEGALPRVRTIPIRALAEVHARQDHVEPAPWSLRVLALARRVSVSPAFTRKPI
jgi:hypothetical protein